MGQAGAAMKCVDLCPSETDLVSPAEFCLLRPTIHKALFSILLTKEDNGEKGQFKATFGSVTLALQGRPIECPSVTLLNFVKGQVTKAPCFWIFFATLQYQNLSNSSLL